MLFLQFHLGKDRYVLDVEQIEEVLPYVAAKAIPGTPDGVVGVINYHGRPVPLIDLSVLALGRPSAPVMSTRIILIRYPSADRIARLLGLVAERATEILARDAADFGPSGIEAGTPPYLGSVATDDHGIIQLIEVEALLPAEIREILFQQIATVS
jgi:chemotaxis-related protein WspB